MTDAALMMLDEDEFRLSTHNKLYHKFELLEKDMWVVNTAASTRITNSDEGMFNCMIKTNQYIKVRSGERHQIFKKACKRCTLTQKSGKRFQVTMSNLTLWCIFLF